MRRPPAKRARAANAALEALRVAIAVMSEEINDLATHRLTGTAARESRTDHRLAEAGREIAILAEAGAILRRISARI